MTNIERELLVTEMKKSKRFRKWLAIYCGLSKFYVTYLNGHKTCAITYYESVNIVKAYGGTITFEE